MIRYTRRLEIFGVAIIALLLAVASDGWTQGNNGAMPFDEATLFLELNHTDGDLGIHSKVDGGPWTNLKIRDRGDETMLGVWLGGHLWSQGLTELFFESAEPPFDELDPRTFFDRFPEGIYRFSGETRDNEMLESETELTHLLPAPPDTIKISGQLAAEDCDVEELPAVDGNEPVVISWEPVTHSHPDLGRTGEPIDVVKYQVVVEREEPSLLILSVDLPPSVAEIEIPAGFIELGEEFKFEILVQEESGNQTAVESCFEVN